MLSLDAWLAFSFYKSFLAWYCEWYEPRYLEIGCLGGDLVASLKTKRAIGIDINTHPDWQTYTDRAPGKVEFLQMTSDGFFKQNTDQWDLIFIDGNHQEEQVAKDVKNSLDCLAPSGLILMHDTLPPSLGDTTQDKCGTAYLVRKQLQRRADLQVYTFPVTFGLTLVAPIPQGVWPW